MTQPAAFVLAFSRRKFPRFHLIVPGLALAGIVASLGVLGAPWIGPILPVPAMVIALVLGISLHAVASGEVFRPGLAFCVKKLLRWAVALLGLRVALADIVSLGWGTVLVVATAMALTIMSGFLLARLLQRPHGFGALAGAATAVCGASAALATSTVVPNYPGKEADIAFVVIAVNALSTLAMVVYPMLCLGLGFDPLTTGILLGATIHDVAQVVGAGYAMSEATGNTAVLVKLFRVFLLLPCVLTIGWWFARTGENKEDASVPVPVFALAFLGLCALNSVMTLFPGVEPGYGIVKWILITLSNAGLVVAIAALGLGTSLTSITALGWRHVAGVAGTTAVILVVVTAGLMLQAAIG